MPHDDEIDPPVIVAFEESTNALNLNESSSSENSDSETLTDRMETGPKILRVYCSGTLFDETEQGELIAEFYKVDSGIGQIDKLHLKGPGKTGVSNIARGAVGGKQDMKANVGQAKEWLIDRICDGVRNNQFEFDIPIMGWSRGAVTSIMISNELGSVKEEVINRLKKTMPPEEIDAVAANLSIKAKLFLIDPVAGPTNDPKTKLGKLRGITASKETRDKMKIINADFVSEVNLIYAKGERRTIMKPIRPELTDKNIVVRAIIMEGEHSSLVTPALYGGSKKLDMAVQKDDSFLLVTKLAELFCIANRIPININPLLEAAEKKVNRELPPRTVMDTIAYLMNQEFKETGEKQVAKSRAHVKRLTDYRNTDYSTYLMHYFLSSNCPNLLKILEADDEQYDHYINENNRMDSTHYNVNNTMDHAYSELKFFRKELSKLDEQDANNIMNKFGEYIESERVSLIQDFHPTNASQDATFPPKPASLDYYNTPESRRKGSPSDLGSSSSPPNRMTVPEHGGSRFRVRSLFSGTSSGPQSPSSSPSSSFNTLERGTTSRRRSRSPMRIVDFFTKENPSSQRPTSSSSTNQEEPETPSSGSSTGKKG